ncbi:biliverdin-producing heme oxygenase [Mangrovimonas sp. ST2L15]|uniref:biliverdin-producing heme oxygenase n=1 Tax=Mangrovimonas sp. ST2L15 TaxID=1645916 RepID=UPI0006B646B3|nr:biliverdin-producing heme oxygenase [Mangrovimonas sp. ST2L15]
MTPSSNNILKRLKEETQVLHANVENLSGADKILNYTIQKEEYKDLLQKNYQAYQQVENLIEPFQDSPELKSLFPRDKISFWAYEDLNRQPNPYNKIDLQLENAFQALGALYVLEGSTMGMSVIAKHLERCEGLVLNKPQRLYSQNSSKIQRWLSYKEQVNELQFSKQEEDEVVKGANKAFLIFQKSFLS